MDSKATIIADADAGERTDMASPGENIAVAEKEVVYAVVGEGIRKGRAWCVGGGGGGGGGGMVAAMAMMGVRVRVRVKGRSFICALERGGW